MRATFENNWKLIQEDARKILSASENELYSFDLIHNLYDKAILQQASVIDSLSGLLASKLYSQEVPAQTLNKLFLDVLGNSSESQKVIYLDLAAIVERDPAADRKMINPLLFFKGFHALQLHRIAHWLWNKQEKAAAFFLQSRSSLVFSVDIHPAAKIGSGILIDHATGIVIGETAVVGNNVSMLHGVTLGGTGKHGGDRHPKIGDGVQIGAGAKILGNIKVGEGSKVAAESVVLTDVPAHTTVAGVPARVVGTPRTQNPGKTMEEPDYEI